MTPDLVTTAFPYDGPHTSASVTAAASALADLTRYLANAGRTRGTVPDGPTLCAVLSHLTETVRSLPQILAQLDVAAERIAGDPTLYDHEGDDAAAAVAAVVVGCACVDAAATAHDLHAELDRAAGLASRLGHRR